VYLKRIRKREEDHCSKAEQKMTRSHVLLHCTNGRLAAARREAWGGVVLSGVRMLLASSRWERRLLHFLELSGIGRVMESGEDEEENRAARIDRWIAWVHRDRAGLAFFRDMAFTAGGLVD
jgi:hypothetical protein